MHNDYVEEENYDEHHSNDRKFEKFSKMVENNHYDEELEVNDSNDELSRPKSQPSVSEKIGGLTNEFLKAKPNAQAPLPKFDIDQFQSLTESNSEFKALFNLMKRFEATEVQLDTKLKPFIPAYIPSIGEVDSFLKVHKPDRSFEDLGLTVIDEQTIEGEDPQTFILKLTYVKGHGGNTINHISTLASAEKNPKEIQNWIDKVADLPKKSSSVSYTKNMPEIESLMQLWPERFETTLNETKIPNENINLPTDVYSKIVCNLLDIPIHKTNTNKALVESLHVLFTLYSVVKENQAYKNIEKAENVQSKKFNQ